MNNILHKKFKLNGRSVASKEDLLDYTQKEVTEIFPFLSDWFDASDFVTVKTSGSTGKPKEIRLKKEHMINSARATGTYFDLPEDTTALLCMPVKFIAGKMMLVRALVLGWQLDVVETSSDPLKDIDKTYDFSAMVPLQLYNSLNKVSLIKKLIVGGGVVSKELTDRIQDVPAKIFATYGMTETITHIAVKALNTDKRSEFYTVLPEVRIGTDERGCLVIDAPEISDERLITNDLVEIISEDHFRWLGRYDHIINSGGIKIIPEETERKLSPYIASRFFISSVPDPKFGERIILIHEGKPKQNLPEIFKKVLTRYEIPKEIFFTEKFTETLTGKIDRNKTKAGI
jgi:O-succinylbenzoic acid--CoA ligase